MARRYQKRKTYPRRRRYRKTAPSSRFTTAQLIGGASLLYGAYRNKATIATKLAWLKANYPSVLSYFKDIGLTGQTLANTVGNYIMDKGLSSGKMVKDAVQMGYSRAKARWAAYRIPQETMAPIPPIPSRKRTLESIGYVRQRAGKAPRLSRYTSWGSWESDPGQYYYLP